MCDKKQHTLLAITGSSSKQTAGRHNIECKKATSTGSFIFCPSKGKYNYKRFNNVSSHRNEHILKYMANETESCKRDMPITTDSRLALSKQRLTASERKWSLSSADVRGEERVTSLRTSVGEAILNFCRRKTSFQWCPGQCDWTKDKVHFLLQKLACIVARTASCRVANAFSTRLKLIWPKSSLKTAKMSKKRVLCLSLN